MTPNDVMAATQAVDYDPFAGVALARVVPTTAPQREIWLASTLSEEGSLAYNESVSLELTGPLDTTALVAALADLVTRHEALRATVSVDGEELCIAQERDLPCPLVDLATLDAAAQAAAIQAALDDAVTTPFDLEHGPLLRASLLRRGPLHHVLVLTAHHIICDGWSFSVLMNDLATLYGARVADGFAPAPADSFAAYAMEEAVRARGADNADARSYWVSRFSGSVPSLDLPTDRPRARRRTFTSRREDRVLDAELVSAIRRMGAKRHASLYATLLAGFALALERISGQQDLVIGIPCAGQAEGGHDALVGHCVNVLPLRTEVKPEQSFGQLVDDVRGGLLDAFDHQQYTIGSLLAHLSLPRDPARLPLVSVLFNLDQALDTSTLSFPGLGFTFSANARRYENFELFINAVQVDGTLRLECQYNADLFQPATIAAWLEAYETLLRGATEAPDEEARRLPAVSDAGRQAIIAMQPAPTPYPENRLAHEAMEQQVDVTPARAAVRHGAERLSYIDLEHRANRIAHCLRKRGVGRGSLVGLCVSRGTDMVATLLGVLKAGAGYVPLDPAFPADRLAFMVEDAALAALIVDVPPTAFPFDPAKTLILTHDRDEIEHAPATRLPRDELSATPDSVAYVIFTSGSTGRPKGVRVPHGALSNFLTSMQRVPGISEADRLVAVTTLSFDIAFMELMLPLSVGAEVIVADHDDVRDGAALRNLVERSHATMMQATPAGWRILIESGWQGHSGFRAVSGGEPLAVDLAEALLQRCGSVWNGYGPTETTIYSTYWAVKAPREGIVIGTPIANTTVYILDAAGSPCPLGVPGEIHIGGAGVTLGYLNRPELTAERFVRDLFSPMPNARMYRTGDRGRWLASGQIEHLGRLDFQVKVRGYRIEPGEIESVLVDLPEVARAVVMAREDRPGDVRLVAYVVGVDGARLDEGTLRTEMKMRLPDYMLPQHVMLLDAIPLLPNGKTDRRALPAPPVQSVATATDRTPPRNDDERRVAAAMEAVLALPDLDVRDNFFALGGHSLLAAQLTARLNREFSVNLSFRTLFDAPTIAELALAIADLKAAGHEFAHHPIVRRPIQDRAPASLMQARLFALEEMQPGRVTYNAPSAHRLTGLLDTAAFEQAFAALVARQASLRTSLRREGDAIVQVVAPHLPTRLFPAEDLSALPPHERERTLMRRLQQLTDTPFDPATAPLFSAKMFRLSDENHAFFFMPHHIIWDGWSFDILYAELSALYRAFSRGEPSPLAALPVSYGDYATWHTQWLEGPQFREQLEFWKDRLSRCPAAQALPTDMPRRPGMSGKGSTEWIRVSRDTTDLLHEVARSADATLNMTLLALYYVLLSGMSGQQHLVVGTPVRGRNQTEVESVMGYFNNLLPLHVSMHPEMTFLDFVRHVKSVALEGFGHPDVPMEYLTRELKVSHGGGNVLYQALFSFQDARQRVVDWGGLEHEQILLFQSGATEDLGLWFLENARGMVGGVTYNADLLHATTAATMRDRYLSLLASAGRDARQTVGSLRELAEGMMRPATSATVTPTPAPILATHTATRTPSEAMLAKLWGELLDVCDVHPGDNFFDLGGHSLLAVDMANRVRQGTGVQLNLLDIANGTLGTLAAELDAAGARGARKPTSLFGKLFGRR
ncbi:amino acid adenylation domain-containing protein [Luteibacter sp. Sphag1AF]|uniref:non-ribosomal peptide synthetase n=1 Tax=Luteibacter sp. Sphag1AF TaxID=2587031 RepID=UPI0016130679|nr:non-ribosomal peptide synthetase [Luteibacter sp. Sphag1AF]MBB3228584.1 amino acid adenylation domain-containing protein [Luteibacter sp. Sphag1AF]